MTASKYYKIGVVKAEQFDGSDEMAHHWGLKHPAYDDSVWAFTEEDFIGVSPGDMLIDDSGRYSYLTKELFGKRYQSLLVIPQAVAYAIEWFQQNDETIGEIWRNAYEDMVDDWEQVPQLREAEEWMLANQDAFTQAWLMGDWEEEETE